MDAALGSPWAVTHWRRTAACCRSERAAARGRHRDRQRPRRQAAGRHMPAAPTIARVG